MNRTIFSSLALGLFLSSIASGAFADKVCLSSTLNKRGKIVNKATVVADDATCPRRSAVLLDTSDVTMLVTSTIIANSDQAIVIQGMPGPTGPVGPQGPRGETGAAGSRWPAR